MIVFCGIFWPYLSTVSSPRLPGCCNHGVHHHRSDTPVGAGAVGRAESIWKLANESAVHDKLFKRLCAVC